MTCQAHTKSLCFPPFPCHRYRIRMSSRLTPPTHTHPRCQDPPPPTVLPLLTPRVSSVRICPACCLCPPPHRCPPSQSFLRFPAHAIINFPKIERQTTAVVYHTVQYRVELLYMYVACQTPPSRLGSHPTLWPNIPTACHAIPVSGPGSMISEKLSQCQLQSSMRNLSLTCPRLCASLKRHASAPGLVKTAPGRETTLRPAQPSPAQPRAAPDTQQAAA